MPLYKDHVHAFKLACQKQIKDLNAATSKDDGAVSRAYYEGYKLRLANCLGEVINRVDLLLLREEPSQARIAFHTPESMARIDLNEIKKSMTDERSMKGYLNSVRVSRMMEEFNLLNDKDGRKKTAGEHDARDQGMEDADRDFIADILPSLVDRYQDLFDPKSHPFEPPGYIFPAPDQKM
jgi:hypothetical protein